MPNSVKVLLVLIVVMISAASLSLSFRLLNPTPPSRLTLATGPVGSAYEAFGERYQEILGQNGIKVELVATRGAIENLELLIAGDVDIGFVTMGSPDGEDALGLRSLGAMFFEPLWVFTSDPVLHAGNVGRVAELRVAIGPPKSRSNTATRSLFRLNGIETDQSQIFEYEPALAAERLHSGDIDAQFIVSNKVSPVIEGLLAAPDIMLVDFRRADAYVALFPELTKLVVPAGVANLALNLPEEDKRVLAFTAILAVQEDLHPITQSLFLEAASLIHSEPDLFHNVARFPSARDQLIRLSDSAKAYYADGRPFLLKFLPYPVAVLVMQLFAAAIPLLGLVLPMLKLLPSAFHWFMRHRFHQVYAELRRIDRGIQTASEEALAGNRGRLVQLQNRVTSLRVPVTYATKIYALKSHINGVLQKVEDEIELRTF